MSVDQIMEATEGDPLQREGRETCHILGWHRHASEGVVAVGGVGAHVRSVDGDDHLARRGQFGDGAAHAIELGPPRHTEDADRLPFHQRRRRRRRLASRVPSSSGATRAPRAAPSANTSPTRP